jgi:small subunit ribosomal protein S3
VGQKTHPLGFRLGITQEHKSNWFIEFNQYPLLLQEDYNIRTYCKPYIKDSIISNIIINRHNLGNNIDLTFETAMPGILVGENGVDLEKLFLNVKKLLPSNRKIKININEIRNADLNANLIADFVVEQLEKRTAFRRVIKKAILKVKQANAVGIKIQVSGRLNGAAMARTEWIRDGRVPLQTLKANIQYSAKEANTIYGILGIKIWLFVN